LISTEKRTGPDFKNQSSLKLNKRKPCMLKNQKDQSASPSNPSFITQRNKTKQNIFSRSIKTSPPPKIGSPFYARTILIILRL
jgi:hypothetical protein